MELYFTEKLFQYKKYSNATHQILKNSQATVISTFKKRFIDKKQRLIQNPTRIQRKVKSSDPKDSIESLNTFKYVDEKEKKKMLKKLHKEKIIRQQKINAELDLKNKNLQEKIEQQQKAEIEIKQQKLEEKLKHLKELHDKNLKKKTERLEILKNSNEELKKVKSAKPLFKEIEERFMTAVELPELDQRKKLLAKKRSMFAPMKLQEIISHKKNYEKILEELQMKRKLKMEEHKLDISMSLGTKNLYKSKIYKISKEIEEKQEELNSKKELDRKKFREKSKQYGDLVHEIYKPRKKMNYSYEKSISQPNFSDDQNIKEKFSKNPHLSKKNSVISHIVSKRKTESHSVSKNPLEISIEWQKRDNSFDYLAHKRKIRLKVNNDFEEKPVCLPKIIEDPNLSSNSKINLIKNRLRSLDKQTKSYELLSEIGNNFLINQNLNESYIDSIKAKLALLNELNNI
jgi:hypothetical protein